MSCSFYRWPARNDVAVVQVAYHISNPAAYSVDAAGLTPQIEYAPSANMRCAYLSTILPSMSSAFLSCCIFRYFNEESLREFINFRPKDNNGVLQRFVHPIGRNNSVTRVWWTPNVVTLETRCNNVHMDNMRVSFTRKSVTFGNPPRMRHTFSHYVA